MGDLVREACLNLYVLRQRSLLALLGIVIGTASVIAMLAIGHMASAEALKVFSVSGVDVMLLQASGSETGAPPALDRRALCELPALHPSVLQIAPLALGRQRVSLGDESAVAGVAASPPSLQALSGLQIAGGRLLTVADRDAQVALIGDGLAKTLSGGVPRSLMGRDVRVGGYVFRVVGVMSPRVFTAFDPLDFNAAVLVPMDSARRVLDNPAIAAAVVRLRPRTDAQALSDRLVSAFSRPGAPAIQVRSARALAQIMQAQKAVHARLLAAIGAVSLLVGGIGVMNVMLMGAMERRREIGLRAAVGARPRDIQLMFLVEAGVLALCGGLAGTAVGVLAAAVVASLSRWRFGLDLYSLPLGVAMASLVGVTFGLYPAVKAARFDPIEALRAD